MPATLSTQTLDRYGVKYTYLIAGAPSEMWAEFTAKIEQLLAEKHTRNSKHATASATNSKDSTHGI